MQPYNRIYYPTVHWRLKMFREEYRSSSGALTVFAASGLLTHVVTGGSQVWVGTGSASHRLGRSPHEYVNQRLKIQLELLMMIGMPLETGWAFNERWNNKFYYKDASCWLLLLSKIKCLNKMTLVLFVFHVQIIIRIRGKERNKILDCSLLLSHSGSLSNRLINFLKRSEL
jgi:hypothetical protein